MKMIFANGTEEKFLGMQILEYGYLFFVIHASWHFFNVLKVNAPNPGLVTT
jgi:hypothetical protein